MVNVGNLKCPFCVLTFQSSASPKTTHVRKCPTCKNTFFYWHGRYYICMKDIPRISTVFMAGLKAAVKHISSGEQISGVGQTSEAKESETTTVLQSCSEFRSFKYGGKTMSKGYCLKCNRGRPKGKWTQEELLDESIEVHDTPRGIKRIKILHGTCPTCGGKVTRIIGK